MQKYHIPTANFRTFDNILTALNYIIKQRFPLVIKTDGLAGGKGAFICKSYTEAEVILNHLMHYNMLGKAGNRVVIEEFLNGEEASLFAFCDGKHFVSTILSQDHKQLKDGDKGPNTGGMGAYAPAIFPENLREEIDETIIRPTLTGMQKEGRPFIGILYVGLMITKQGPKVLEFNCRLGDPEAQVILPLLENDLVDICQAILKKNINRVKLRWKEQSAVAVVLASAGYPGKYQKGKEISGLEDADSKDVIIFFSGIKKENGKYFTNGGRVMSVTAIANTLFEAKQRAYKSLQRISFEGMQFRKDIAQKGLQKISKNRP
jgi:phosphoribosylamine--glycine ligase